MVVSIRLRLRKPRLPRLSQKARRRLRLLRDWRVRATLALTALLIIAGTALPVLKPYFIKHTYALGNAETLLPDKSAYLGTKLKPNYKDQKFDFNEGYFPGDQTGKGGEPRISASTYVDGQKGLTVFDPVNNVEFTLTPKFKLLEGKKDGNRIVYPLRNGTGWLVYTMQAGGVKEDVVLKHANGNKMVLEYELGLGDGLEARLVNDGDIGVYGSSTPLTGQVVTGSEKDAQLLKKAREKATKDKLLFTIPAPVAYEAGGAQSPVNVHYELNGNILRTVATDLKKGNYPLTIDPTVTVTAATDLFRDTNPESNVDFNATTGEISRGAVTGGVIPAWTSNTNNLGTARFLHSATIYDDYAYVAGGAGANSTSNLTSVEYARLSSANATIGTWATTTALPTALSRFQLVAYNGYLYAVGGSTTNTSCGTVSTNVYYNRMQTNGQLSGTWSTATVLPAGLCGMGAAVYNNRLYVVGGKTGSAANTGVTTAYHAAILPGGGLSSWTTDDSVLPAARYDNDVRIYNGYVYVVGGNLNGTLTNTVLYAPLASDGSIYGTGSGSWKSASTFGTARSNMGSSFTSSYDGYMYVHGGCSTFNATFSCTAIRNETQVAQINADGTLGPWSDIATTVSSLSRVGNAVTIWRGTVYSFAGCTSMNTGTISCATGAPTLNSQSYSTISTPGQVGPVNSTTTLPTALFAHGSVVNNGYLYIVGGCITNSCQAGTSDTTGNTSFAPINADGTVGTWTTNNTNILNSAGIGGDTGLAAFGLAVYNNFLYVTGGYTQGGPTRNVYYVGLNPSTGNLTGNWNVVSNMLPETNYYNSAVAYRGFLYVFGGCIATTGSAGCSTYRNRVARATIASNGTPGSLITNTTNPSTLATLPASKALMAPALYNGYIYLAGGATSSASQTDTILYARIQDDGSITSWINGATGTTGNLVNTLRRADAVAMNGYLYVLGGHNGVGPVTYPDIHIGKIDMATGDITNDFTNSVIKVTARWDTRAVFSNGYIYVTGGCATGDPASSCSSRSNLVEYVEVFNAGNKGTSVWNNEADVYTTNRTSMATTVYNGYIYAAGGCTNYTVGTTFSNTLCVTGSDAVEYAAINPDGSLGAWTTAPNLTAGNSRVGGCLAALGGYLYYMGGQNASGNAIAGIRYTQIGSNGAPGSWSASSQDLPNARAWGGCATFAGRVYVTGGVNGAGTRQDTVYYSPDLSAGGDITQTWNTGTSFTGIRSNHTSVAVGGYLFVMGGDDGTNALMDVQSIQLNPSTGATTGSWQYSRELPQGISYQGAIAANGYVYLFGGRTAATSCVVNTYINSVNSTGRLGEWSQGVNNFTTARFGAAAAFNEGYYYLLGGNDCTNIVSSNQIQYGGQQSQAMKGLLSKYADLNGDGTPRAFVAYLTNAVNNGVDIEKWRLRYRSSAESANSWGQSTMVYPITSEATSAVSSLDGSGTDVKLSRWFWFSLEMNMEHSFTFTDDTRPTISQYELHYSPPPGKRLMHGRDFRDQTQQGLDASPL